MATFTSYIADVRRLLHDATGVFWSDTELTDYINDARHRVVRDTGCLRAILTGNTTTSVETFDITTLTLPSYADQILDVINVNLYWGNTRIPLRYMSWSQFNAELRFWQNYTGRPIAFTRYAQSTIYLGPVPDQVYVMEFDTIVLPVALTSDSQTEPILEPYTSPVAFYAAYKAKYKEQSYGEAEIFNAEYKKQLLAAINSSFTRRLPTPYSVPY